LGAATTGRRSERESDIAANLKVSATLSAAFLKSDRRVRGACAVRANAKRSRNFLRDAEAVHARCGAVKRDGRSMGATGQRVTGVAVLRVTHVRFARHLRGVEWQHRHQRRTAPRAVLAGVEAFAGQGMGDEGFGFSVVPLTAARAACKASGRLLPRLSARRRIPLQAVALKKYRCCTSPVSKTSDNEHAAASLWNSGVLSVKNPVGEPIPELPQEPEEGAKIPSSV
jgi:hypothetical protein